MAENSGGTGIVLRSNTTRSLILTNSHVCGVVVHGGVVKGVQGKFMVSSYKRSLKNDLCLIRVEGDLGANTKISKSAPIPYREVISVSGHPALMPNIITKGHLSGREPLQVMIGMRRCTEAETQNPNTGLLCMLVGGLPIVKSFDSALVSATIMPGSSGSGVYNNRNELIGVVFAGSGAIGYGWTVPYQSMMDFLSDESKTMPFTNPDNVLDLYGGGRQEGTTQDLFQKLNQVCKSTNRDRIEEACSKFNTSIWYK